MSKTKRKRIISGFTLSTQTTADLDKYSKLTSIPKSRLVENALRIAYQIGGNDDRNRQAG